MASMIAFNRVLRHELGTVNQLPVISRYQQGQIVRPVARADYVLACTMVHTKEVCLA